MDVYRIHAVWMKPGVLVDSENVELVAGLTPTGQLAQGDWYGRVQTEGQLVPFVLKPNGHCVYGAGADNLRYCDIVLAPVAPDTVFSMTWEANDGERYQYKVVAVARLNTHADA